MGISQEEEKFFKGEWFSPGHPDLTAMKKKAHDLNMRYNALFEDEREERDRILTELLGGKGKDCRIQGPVFFHYGSHTRVGDRFFANFNLTVQDDAIVTIGDDCNFGPSVMKHLCMAKPVTIGNDLSSVPGWPSGTAV